MKLEHAGAPLELEDKIAYMERKAEERHQQSANRSCVNAVPVSVL